MLIRPQGKNILNVEEDAQTSVLYCDFVFYFILKEGGIYFLRFISNKQKKKKNYNFQERRGEAISAEIFALPKQKDKSGIISGVKIRCNFHKEMKEK